MDVLEEKPIINQNSENNDDKNLKQNVDIKQEYDNKQQIVYLKPDNFLNGFLAFPANSANIKQEKPLDIGIDYLAVASSCAAAINHTVNTMAANNIPTSKTNENTNRFTGINQPQVNNFPTKVKKPRRGKGSRSKNNINNFLQCETCGMSFDQLSNLKIHQEAAHKIVKYVNCNKCDKVFCGMKDLEQHWKGTGICRKCKQNFYYPCVLIRHKCPGSTAANNTRQQPQQSGAAQSTYKNTAPAYPATGSNDAGNTVQIPKVIPPVSRANEVTDLNHQKRPMTEPLVSEQPNKTTVLAKDIHDSSWCTWTVQKPPKHVCKECGVQFEKLTELSKHQEKVREMEGIPRCPKCYKFFNNMNEAHLHLVGSGFCLKCGKDMELPCMLIQHSCPLAIVPSIARATAGVISMVNVVCTICSVKFQTQESYVTHLRNDHNINTDELLCKECGLLFSKKADLTAHEEMFHNNELHRCYKCLKIFRERYKLYVHQQGSGICMLCGEDLEMPCMLIRHTCKANNVKEQLARLQQTQQDQSQNNALQAAIPDNNDFVTTFCSLCKTKFQNHAIYLAHVRMYHCLNLPTTMQ
ncbi:hypothetical protein O3M35_011999 [Rhynocoris fuscipes]|uniref:C2H2-type domain-containing protein n=1 Tax=Rhynocoris fuscipes TaxID=488301 RepID=A0AAW1CRY8_9HEMI